MNTPLLTTRQLQEIDIRLNGTPMKTAEQHNFEQFGTLRVGTNPTPISSVFSAQLAKVIGREEDLRFGLMLVKNALELGQVDLALQQCNKALGIK